MTATIGLSEYTILHFSGTTSELKPTGETYKPNWTTKGTRYRKSRNLVLRAANHKPAPRAVASASNNNAGSKSIRHVGTIWYHAIMTSSSTKVIRKSTRLTTMEVAGTIRRGKKTFEIKFALLSSEALLSENEFAKNCHGSNAA